MKEKRRKAEKEGGRERRREEENGEETFYLDFYNIYSKCFGDKAMILVEKQSEWRKSCTDVKKI